MDNTRDASASMNGYFYQRYCCVYYILNETNYEYILEEGYEDIDMIRINDNRAIIQVKYCCDTNEKLLFNTGLFKVICSNFDKLDIDKIIYVAYNTNEYIYNQSLQKAFNDKNYYDIGKYLLVIIYKHINNIKNNSDILNIDYEFRELELKIKQKLNNNKKYKKFYAYFSQEENCIKYFNKFALENGKTFNNLITDINNKILEKYNDFVQSNNNDIKQIKIFLIRNIIFEYLTNKMFNNKINRKIIYKDIIHEINNKIKILINKDNLFYELLKQNAILINEYYNKNNVLYIEPINEIIQSNFSTNDLDIISFLICLLNKYILKLNNLVINKIKLFLINILVNKFIKIDDDKKLLYIKYLAMISNNYNKKYKLPFTKLLKMIDPNYNPNKYF